MAEGWAKHFTNGNEEIISAGIEAHGKNPRAIISMQEAGVEIYGQESTVLNDSMLENLDYLITVCSNADSDCPNVETDTIKEFWPIPDPAKITGSKEEIKEAFNAVRDDLKARIEDLTHRLDIYALD